MFNLSVYVIRQWRIVGQEELTINVPIYAAHDQVPIVHISWPSQMIWEQASQQAARMLFDGYETNSVT